MRCIQTFIIQERHKQRYLSQRGCELIPGWSCYRYCESIVIVFVMRMKNCYFKTWQECFYYCNVCIFLFPFFFFVGLLDSSPTSFFMLNLHNFCNEKNIYWCLLVFFFFLIPSLLIDIYLPSFYVYPIFPFLIILFLLIFF